MVEPNARYAQKVLILCLNLDADKSCLEYPLSDIYVRIEIWTFVEISFDGTKYSHQPEYEKYIMYMGK